MLNKNLLIAAAATVFMAIASSPELRTVSAVNYNYNIDFSTKEVANFTSYKQMFSTSTYNLTNQAVFKITTDYKFDACPTTFTVDMAMQVIYAINGANDFYNDVVELPDLTCSTTYKTYNIQFTQALASQYLSPYINDDTNYMRFRPYLVIRANANTNGRLMTFKNPFFVYRLEYDFNTTYMFNNFLSDLKFGGTSLSGSTWNDTTTTFVGIEYLYSTIGNDTYTVFNTASTSIGTTRKKYAINVPDTWFRGKKIGVQFNMIKYGELKLTMGGTGNAGIFSTYDYYYLNAANSQKAIINGPVFNYTYQDCGWNVFNIPCFLNNGVAWLTNDAPLISDVIDVLNPAISIVSQAFGTIGNLNSGNLIGFLILVGFGVLVVRWFLA